MAPAGLIVEVAMMLPSAALPTSPSRAMAWQHVVPIACTLELRFSPF
jgi:hypothetical protein